jgi:5'-3' exonuclease
MGCPIFEFISGSEITADSLAGSVVAIDAMNEIYRAATAIPGVELGYLNVIPTCVKKFALAGVRQIWVFDATPPVLKAATLAARKSSTSARVRVTAEMVNQVRELLTFAGITCYIAPDGHDAEQICALLNIAGTVNHVVTTDGDAVLYGAKSVIKHQSRKMYQYKTVDFATVHPGLVDSATGAVLPGLVKLGVVLGTDFAAKTPGIGPKTVFKKIGNIELTADQKAAAQQFAQDRGLISRCKVFTGLRNLGEVAARLGKDAFSLRIYETLANI